MGISNLASGLRGGVCTSTTRPQNPFEGQMVYETDTNQVLVYDGSAWVFLTPQRNLLFNGAMQVAQRGTSASGKTTSGYYTADRWNFEVGSIGTWTQSVENDAPTGSGFRKSLKMLCTSATASPAAGGYCLIGQRFEGQNLQSIKKGTSSAEQVALTFWVKSNVTGTYIAELYDNDNTRQASASYTVNASATWEKKTIVFPADTTGAFDNDNAYSLSLFMHLAAGSNYTSGTLNTVWASATAANRVVGQTNLAAATNNYWQITGVQLNVGANASPFEFKDYGTELAECQRYYWKWVSKNNGDLFVGVYQPASTPFYQLVPMPVTMRARPTSATVSGTWTVINTANQPSIYDRGDSWLILQSAVNPVVGNTAQSGFYSSNNSSTLEQDAEL